MPPEYKPLLLVAVIFLGFPVYFLPAYVAAKREHPKRKQIVYWNLFTAWTGVAWVALMLWAATKTEK